MCACHIKQGKWQRAVDTADKVSLSFTSHGYNADLVRMPQVLAKNADNVKAKFRKGKALGELGFFEKANAMLEELLKADEKSSGGSQDPETDAIRSLRAFLDAPAIRAELQRFKVMEKEVTKKADTKMRGQFVEKAYLTASC
jgi:hypothetical protein